MKKRLAIDVGEAHIGLAKAEGWLVEPMEALALNTVPDLISILQSICTADGIEEVVIGLTSGTSGMLAKQLGGAIEKQCAIQVAYVEEAYSSFEARERAKKQNKKLRNFKDQEHSWAAAIILERYIDSQS